MLFNSVKFRKIREIKIKKLERQKSEEQCFYQNVQYVIKTYQTSRSYWIIN